MKYLQKSSSCRMKVPLSILLYSNLFYGVCAVALAFENQRQLGLPPNHLSLYMALFAGTVVFYTLSYSFERNPAPTNRRAAWIAQNRTPLLRQQLVLTLLAAAAAAWWLSLFGRRLAGLNTGEWLLLLSVPVVAFGYYGFTFPGLPSVRLRQLGWLKPFLIGWVWAGAVSLYPTLFIKAEHPGIDIDTLSALWFLLKNWMFVTVSCILFDVKDYAADHNRDLKTFVVRVGLRATLFRIVIPLVLVGFAFFLLFAVARGFGTWRILANALPYLAMLSVALGLQQRRSIDYYLLAIDGLLLFKACCGILGSMA